MSYTTSLKVRFGDIDHAGIAYYPNLYHDLHIAFEEFFEEHLGTPYPRALDEEKLGFPTVHVETDFLSPIRYGDTLDITITVPRLGDSSADLLFTVVRRGDTDPCLVSRHTVVAIDMTTFRPRAIPPPYRDLLAACAT
jgi:4-hydroxybenzoyl-CoA thioesterase